MISIHVQNVSKRFGSTVALQKVTLEISAGEIFFLLGPSGCGKTTLLRTLAGFVFPDEGEILFDGKIVTQMPPHRRKGIGMVFQNYALWPHLSVGKNVSFGLEQMGMPRTRRQERVHEVLRTMRLKGLADRGIAELSGGQQQRVALARALAVYPHCLLLDEPLSNLDAQLRVQMRGELRSLCREQGVTAIHVTHDQKEALSTADRIAVMADGIIRQVGTPEEIYRHPTDSFVASFIGEANLIDGQVVTASDGKLIVQTALGLISSEISQDQEPFSSGSKCTLCIRPEMLRIESHKVSGENSFTAQIETSVFLGEAVEHHAQTQTGLLKILDWRSSRTLPHRNEISLVVDPRDVAIFRT